MRCPSFQPRTGGGQHSRLLIQTVGGIGTPTIGVFTAGVQSFVRMDSSPASDGTRRTRGACRRGSGRAGRGWRRRELRV